MCKDHSGVLVSIPTASVTFSDQTPRPNGNKRGVDACIAPIVKALNDGGVGTVASCCGHGTHVGSVALSDGRELLVVPDFETARRYDGPLRSVEQRTGLTEKIDSLLAKENADISIDDALGLLIEAQAVLRSVEENQQ